MANDWQPIPLCEVLTERQEKPSPADLESGAIRIVSKIGFNDGKIQLRNGGDTKTGMILVRPGDLIVSGINAVKGAIAIYDEKAQVPIAATIHYGSYIPNRERVDIQFLWWLLRSEVFREILLRNLPGGIKSELKPQRFLSVPVPLPSLSEQQRIVARVDAMARRVEEARGLRRAAVDEAEAVVVAAMREIFAADKRDGWLNLTVEEACEAMIDYRGRTPPISDHGVPHLTSANIKNGGIDWQKTKFVSEETYKTYMTRGIPKPGDVIFTMEAPLGDAAVVPDERRFSLAQRTLLLRGKRGVVEGNFLAKVLTSPDVHEMIYARATGTTVKGIASKRLRYVSLPIPPLPDQRRIVAYLDGLQAKGDDLRRLQAETQKELDALMPSILAKAFAGEL